MDFVDPYSFGIRDDIYVDVWVAGDTAYYFMEDETKGQYRCLCCNSPGTAGDFEHLSPGDYSDPNQFTFSIWCNGSGDGVRVGGNAASMANTRRTAQRHLQHRLVDGFRHLTGLPPPRDRLGTFRPRGRHN